MRFEKVGLVAILITLLIAGCAQYQAPQQTPTPQPQGFTVKITDHPKFGKILTDGKGITLYIFTKDETNKSNCYDVCAKNWPPLTADKIVVPDELKGKVWFIERKDGSKQVAYMGKPLYYFFKDKKPGDTFGEGVKGVWFVVKIGGGATGGYSSGY